MFIRPLVAVAILVHATSVAAQQHVHRPGMTHEAQPSTDSVSRGPQQGGQSAFAAIAEIVRILSADASTDWPKVNIEALRQHLIDMDDVTLRSVVEQAAVPGGARFTVRGEGRVAFAIRRMAKAHAQMVGAERGEHASVEEIPGGARVTITAANARDTTKVARIRALGFVGLLTTGDHHGPHHIAMARGDAAGHGH